jgi:hypothetical protein
MAVTYYSKMVVADITALKSLTDASDPAIADGIFLAVADNGEGNPDWYYYDSSGADSESLPDIVEPTTASGRWYRFRGETSSGGGVQATGSTTPVGNVTPGAVNSLYVQRVTTGQTKEVIWLATGVTNSDWVAISSTPIIDTTIGDPDGAYTADLTGQIWLYIQTGYGTPVINKYIAEEAGTTNWQAW